MKHRTGQSSISVMLASVCSIVSFLCCTVRDDRDVCPSRLELDCTGLAPGEVLLVLRSEGVLDHADTISLPGALGADGTWRGDVPGRLCAISIFSPVEAVATPREGYVVGKECAPVLAWSRCFVPERPLYNFSVKLGKEYCRITLRGVGDLPEGMSCRLRSRVDGIKPGGELSIGDCEVEAVLQGDGSRVANVLRQRDDSLLLEIVEKDGEGEKVCRSFALGGILIKAGYDWDAPDLEDLVLDVDFAKGLLGLKTDKWSKTFEFAFVF